MISTFNMFSPKKIYLHTSDGHGIPVVLNPQRDTPIAAGMAVDHWLLFQLLTKVEPAWNRILFSLDDNLLDWTIQQRLKISGGNVAARTTSQTVVSIRGEVKLKKRVAVVEEPA